MDNYGFFRVRAHVPVVKIADIEFNTEQIISAVREADSANVDSVTFPELSVTGYTCADLFHQQVLLDSTEKAIKKICEATKDSDVIFAVGAPVVYQCKIYNCAVVIYKGYVRGIVPKSYLPNYGEFYEKRWFESGMAILAEPFRYADSDTFIGTHLIFNFKGVRLGIEICEDLWVPQPPSGGLCMAGAEIIMNLSASDDLIGKHDYLVSLIGQQSARCRCAYVYASAGWGESSTDLVFSGKAIIGYDGAISGAGNQFLTHAFSETQVVDIEKLRLERSKFNTFREISSELRYYQEIEITQATESIIRSTDKVPLSNPHPFIPSDPEKLNAHCREIINIQSYGLMRRLSSIGCKKAVVGISGGLDSTLALLVTVDAFDKLRIPRSGIIGVTMPGLATSKRTKTNAHSLMEHLGVTSFEIPIREAVALHFKDIGQDPQKFDATYENSQARERTQILMDLANKEGAIVIGTGDMSELALGWCTYNGDQMSMYGVNASVPKTLVKHLVNWIASNSPEKVKEVLIDICDTPISPELVPSENDDIAQITEDLVGPYELHDFFLYHFLRNSFSPKKIFYLAATAFKDKYSQHTILKWLKVFYRRFFTQQFKRSCMPDGPKVGSVNLSPRGDWRMPSDACYNMWINQLEEILPE